jgi:hypothetical protein
MSTKKKFYFNDDKTKPIHAGGVIIYRFSDDKIMEILLIETKSKYEDIGGKVDKTDVNVIDTISRETEEETNGVIKAEDIIDRLEECINICYNKDSKYVLYFIEATDEETKLVKKDFGDFEKHDDFKRTISWVKTKTIYKPNFIKYKLNHRLKFKPIIDNIKFTEKNLSIGNMFE